MTTIVGNPVLLVIDIQKDGLMPSGSTGIPLMPGFRAIVERSARVLAAARRADVPAIFFLEEHRASGIDIGRELDGAESMHCVEGAPGTALVDELKPAGDREFFVMKRRYSCFIGTELDILLRALRAETLIMVGCLTDVCVHYTAADAHQRDYVIRVLPDCVLGSSEAAHRASLNAIEYLQRDALVPSDKMIAALESRSSVPA
jgi:nicotinamidase-related amidase